jgi:hypothetical protein
MVVEHGLDRIEQVLGGELAVGVARGPEGFEAEALTILKPVGNLLDSGLFEIGRKGRGGGRGVGAREDVAAGVGDTRKAKG